MTEQTASLGRRKLLASTAWGAPLVAVAVTAPIVAASGGKDISKEFTAQAYSMWNANEGGQGGPLSWAGGQIGWSWSPSGTTTANVAYTVTLIKPDSSSILVLSSSQAMTSGSITIPAQTVLNVKPLPAGTYTIVVSVTVNGFAGPSAQNSVTI